MTYVVYADVIFIFNCITNLISLTVLSIIAGKTTKKSQLLRYVLLLSSLSTFLDVYFLGNYTIHHILYASLYIFILKKYINIPDIRKCIQIYLFIIAILSIADALLKGYSLKSTLSKLLIWILVYIASELIFKNHGKLIQTDSKYCDVTLNIDGRIISANGFYDTGNSLTDPYTKAPVIILDISLLKMVIPKEAYDCIDTYTKEGYWDYTEFKEKSGILSYPILYSTVSTKNTSMPAIKLKAINIGNNIYKNVTGGLSRYPLSPSGKFKILLNNLTKPISREENSND